MDRKPEHDLDRREFLAVSAAGGAGLVLGAPAPSAQEQPTGGRKKYAIVGTGGRHYMYLDATTKGYSQYCELVGLCDKNEGRALLSQASAERNLGRKVPIFAHTDFDKMIRETRPDTVIVTTVDGFHHEYIIRAMELGCDAITEKPMTIDAEKCRAILETQKKTGKKCRVTFNYRYSPPRTQIKDLLMSGVIGDILSVDFHWMLNTHHGADYFRRWHSEKRYSGGLMVHKATHHFDLINWWLSAVPATVTAMGKREFYTPEMARRFGLEGPHERCHTCPEKEKCGFYLDITRGGLRTLYFDQEKYDGYFRDRCVFRPDITIEDTMNVLVRYDNNVTLCYSLNAFNSWEGYFVVFNGTKGRIEHKAEESVYISGDGSVPGAIKKEGTYIRIYPLRAPAYQVDVWTGQGGHGGGDQVLLDDIFNPNPQPDKYLRAADQRGGACSILIGIAANECFRTGKPVEIAELVPGLERPDYPPMPTHTEPVPMPGKG